MIYANGQGVVRDNLAAATWMRLAAEQEHTLAQFNLAQMYEQGRGVAQDLAEAVRWYGRASRLGHAPAQFRLGTMHEQGIGVARNFGQAVNFYRLAAEQDHAGAQTSLGEMYAAGRGVAQHFGDAMIWYRRAAEQGSTQAQYNLGTMYERGEGVPQNMTEAAGWYRIAAGEGHAASQYKLGTMHVRGVGVAQDYGAAATWYLRAAEQEHTLAQSSLGTMYIRGQGVDRDDAEGVRWLRRAAEQGILAGPVQSGSGVYPGSGRGSRTLQRPRAWYRRAAEQGHAPAQYNLGVMYYNGDGVPQDNVLAHVWANLAASRPTGCQLREFAELLTAGDLQGRILQEPGLLAAGDSTRRTRPRSAQGDHLAPCGSGVSSRNKRSGTAAGKAGTRVQPGATGLACMMRYPDLHTGRRQAMYMTWPGRAMATIRRDGRHCKRNQIQWRMLGGAGRCAGRYYSALRRALAAVSPSAEIREPTSLPRRRARCCMRPRPGAGHRCHGRAVFRPQPELLVAMGDANRDVPGSCRC